MSKHPFRRDYLRLTEEEVLSRCKAGDTEAFNVLIGRYEKKVFNLTLRYLRDYHRALEEAQEVFVKVFRKIKLFHGHSAFGTWLYRLTTNHCLNVLKAKKQRMDWSPQRLSLDHVRDDKLQAMLRDDRVELPDATWENQRLRAQMLALIDTLPLDQRQAVWMCHYEHLSYRRSWESGSLPCGRVCIGPARRFGDAGWVKEVAAVTDRDRENLMAYLDGELAPEARAEFEKRLQADHELRAEKEAMERLTRDIEAFAPEALEPPPSLREGVMDRLKFPPTGGPKAGVVPPSVRVAGLFLAWPFSRWWADSWDSISPAGHPRRRRIPAPRRKDPPCSWMILRWFRMPGMPKPPKKEPPKVGRVWRPRTSRRRTKR